MKSKHISDLKPDERNARRHNQRNLGMIEDSLREVGFARSIVIDEDNRILAGNGTIEVAGQMGMENVIVVPADGNTVVAVQRTGLTEEQKARLALWDNRAAETAEWDASVLAALAEDGVKLDDLFVQDELDALLQNVPESEWADALGSLPDGEKAPFQQMTFTVTDAQAEEVKAAMDAAKRAGDFGDTGNENSNGNALARICAEYLTNHG